MDLADEGCEACRPGAASVAGEERYELLKRLPGWEIVVRDGMDVLTRRYPFDDFAAAMAFAARVGALADAADHHPEITVEWGAATVRWWTHTISGLHRNDFVMAARCDRQATPGKTGR